MKPKQKLIEYLGAVPRISFGPNRGRMDRKATSDMFGFSPIQIHKAYLNWQDIFRKEGSTLTFHGYLQKLVQAKITPSDVGNKPDQFNLARINDEGPYTEESCRFITKRANCDEQINRPGSFQVGNVPWNK